MITTILIIISIIFSYLFTGGIIEEIYYPGEKNNPINILLWPVMIFGFLGNAICRKIKHRKRKPAKS